MAGKFGDPVLGAFWPEIIIIYSIELRYGSLHQTISVCKAVSIIMKLLPY